MVKVLGVEAEEETGLGLMVDEEMECGVCGYRCRMGRCWADVDGDGGLGCPICFGRVRRVRGKVDGFGVRE